MPVRKYDQRLRAASTEETRRRILDATYQRLREAPTEPVSVERVAAMAGVSRSTVYLVFGSRAGLFDALGDDLRHEGGFDRPPDATSDSDARAGLIASVRASVALFARHREVLRVLYSMAQLDPDAVGGALTRMAQARAAGLEHYAQRLADQNALRPGLTTEEATHLLWAITGFEFFDQLHGRSLPAETTAALMIAATERTVLTGR